MSGAGAAAAASSSSSASGDVICSYSHLGCKWRLPAVQYGSDEEASRATVQHHIDCCMALRAHHLQGQVTKMQEEVKRMTEKLAMKEAAFKESLRYISKEGREAYQRRVQQAPASGEGAGPGRVKQEGDDSAAAAAAPQPAAASADAMDTTSASADVSAATASAAAASVPLRASPAAAVASAAPAATSSASRRASTRAEAAVDDADRGGASAVSAVRSSVRVAVTASAASAPTQADAAAAAKPKAAGKSRKRGRQPSPAPATADSSSHQPVHSHPSPPPRSSRSSAAAASAAAAAAPAAASAAAGAAAGGQAVSKDSKTWFTASAAFGRSRLPESWLEQRAQACLNAVNAAGKKPAPLPFRPAVQVSVPLAGTIQHMTFDGTQLDVRTIDGHAFVDFSVLLPALQQAGLFPQEDPNVEDSLAPAGASSAIQWLMYLTNRDFPAGAYWSGKEYDAGPWGSAVANDVRLVDGVPWVCVHALNGALSELLHFDDIKQRRAKRVTRQRFLDACTPLLNEDSYLASCEGCINWRRKT